MIWTTGTHDALHVEALKRPYRPLMSAYEAGTDRMLAPPGLDLNASPGETSRQLTDGGFLFSPSDLTLTPLVPLQNGDKQDVL